jgi:hypothetical protein
VKSGTAADERRRVRLTKVTALSSARAFSSVRSRPRAGCEHHLRLGRGAGAQFFAQECAAAAEHTQRLGAVARVGVQSHQPLIGRLAERVDVEHFG